MGQVQIERRGFRILVVLPILVAAVGCAEYRVVMTADRPPEDESVLSPQASAKDYGKIMAIPPSGTARGEFDKVIALFEREFLKAGLTVISGAITGRVVYEAEGTGEKRVEGAAQLSDAERALVMAKDTGADAILQIGEFAWSNGPVESRFFVLDPGRSDFRETAPDEYRSWNGETYVYSSPVLSFVGRMIDVETGQVLATFKIECALNWSLPRDHVRIVEPKKETLVIVSESYAYADPSWNAEASDRTQEKVIQRVAERIQGSSP